MRISQISKAGLLLTLAGGGCATAAPPAELLTARASYASAEQGVAAKYDPADLHTAHKALQASEKSYLDNGDTVETRDLAYTADRRAQIAEARAKATQQTETQQKTVSDMHSAETSQLRATSAQLGQANQQLASKDQQLATEKEARVAAEKRAAQAAADLAKFASVKQEARGMVITLSGGVLFASAKSDLLPEAQVKLNSVAESLTQQDPDSKMVVEGHTDSQGGVSYNQDLSQRRAQTVRDYLVSRGIAADRVTSQGFGSSRSVADNKSAEGRANNRRVEIVVAPTAAAGGLSQR
jgi:outer membrane protein OmpA-like peptidoglycan-associated protein